MSISFYLDLIRKKAKSFVGSRSLTNERAFYASIGIDLAIVSPKLHI